MECRISVKAEFITLYVDADNVTGPWNGTSEHPYQNITNALEHAKDGHTIFVRAGIYYEHVVVNKSVSLVGEDRDSAIVDGNGTGSVISIEQADNVNISGFTIRYSGHENDDSGIYVVRSSGNDISHNTITNNQNGMYLGTSSYNVVSGNTIKNNDDGISFWSSSYNVVSGNTISSNNDDGTSLYRSSNNVVSGNTIVNNHYGISPLYSSDNIIYCNNFNNTDQVWSDYSTNVWDYENKGNYWSDYEDRYPNATETNGSGIWDTPYVIDETNQDNHPLMGVFSDFSVTHKEETYHITTICNSTISEFRFEIGPETGNKIIRFNVTDKDGTVGFCRVTIPTELMNYPYVVLVGVEEIVPTLLDVSNETQVCPYLTYIHSARITIISSKTLTLYNELLYDYGVLLGNYSQLQNNYRELNSSYQELLYDYGVLLGNYSRLQQSYRELNSSYQEHLSDYSKSVSNIRNLMYIFVATTAIFIITTIYLSKHAHKLYRNP